MYRRDFGGGYAVLSGALEEAPVKQVLTKDQKFSGNHMTGQLIDPLSRSGTEAPSEIDAEVSTVYYSSSLCSINEDGEAAV
jgi:hypothetical protein